MKAFVKFARSNGTVEYLLIEISGEKLLNKGVANYDIKAYRAHPITEGSTPKNTKEGIVKTSFGIFAVDPTVPLLFDCKLTFIVYIYDPIYVDFAKIATLGSVAGAYPVPTVIIWGTPYSMNMLFASYTAVLSIIY